MQRALPKKSLTPDEFFRCRVGLALGKAPSEVEELGSSDYDLLHKYWEFEPWGPWRDNMHAAILAREVRRAAFGSKKEPPLDAFFVMHPIERERLENSKSVNAKQGILSGLKALAGTRKKASERKTIKVQTRRRKRIKK